MIGRCDERRRRLPGRPRRRRRRGHPDLLSADRGLPPVRFRRAHGGRRDGGAAGCRTARPTHRAGRRPAGGGRDPDCLGSPRARDDDAGVHAERAHRRRADRVAGLAAGADDYLVERSFARRAGRPAPGSAAPPGPPPAGAELTIGPLRRSTPRRGRSRSPRAAGRAHPPRVRGLPRGAGARRPHRPRARARLLDLV